MSDVFRNSKISIYNGDTLIRSVKKPKLAPGEMESVKLTKDMLSKVSQLTFSIEEVF